MTAINTSRWKQALTAGLAFVAITVAGAEDAANFAAPLSAEYERPGVDYATYDRLIINDLDVDETKILPPPWTEGKSFKWMISERNVSALQKEFQASRILGRAGAQRDG